MSCDLCALIADAPGSRRTACHHRDRVVVVVDCETCGVPMIVFAFHLGTASHADVAHAEAVASALGIEVTRRVAKRCPAHAHWHGRWRKVRRGMDVQKLLRRSRNAALGFWMAPLFWLYFGRQDWASQCFDLALGATVLLVSQHVYWRLARRWGRRPRCTR